MSWGHDDRDGYTGDNQQKPRSRAAPYARGDRQGGGAGVTLTITGLSDEVDWRVLKKDFSEAGTVVRADVEDGVGSVKYAEAADAKWALDNWNNSSFHGKKIRIKRASEGAGRTGGREAGGGRGGGKGKGRDGGKGGRGGGKGGKNAREPRKKVTKESLDKGFADYWGKAGDAGAEKVKELGELDSAARAAKKESTSKNLNSDMDAYFAKKAEASASASASASAEAEAPASTDAAAE